MPKHDAGEPTRSPGRGLATDSRDLEMPPLLSARSGDLVLSGRWLLVTRAWGLWGASTELRCLCGSAKAALADSDSRKG